MAEYRPPYIKKYKTGTVFLLSYKNMGNCEEELPEKPVSRLSAVRLPTGYQHATDRLPTVSKIENLLWKHVVNMTQKQ